MKIAILYICTGKYDIFWKGFYQSSEEYFFVNEQKTYFVFTDSTYVCGQESENVKIVFQENLGWPGNTLFRYHMFSKIETELIGFDYIFFFNANMQFVKKVGWEMLPIDEGVVVTQHPGFYNKKNAEYTYERNNISSAHIPKGQGKVYVCGGLNGGTSNAYINLINTIRDNTDDDYAKGIIAVWHDESHLNRYILGHTYKLLDASYAYPEGWNLPFEPKIIIRDKEKYGGHNYLRDAPASLWKKVITKAKKTIKNFLRK